MNCDIVFKGSATNKNHWKNNGAVRKDGNLDLSEYDAMTKVWYKKSQFWGSLNPTATVKYEDWGGSEGETTYRCNNKDEVQIFNVEPNERKKVEGVHTIHFSNSCEGKTILINVRGGGNRAVDAAGMHFKDKQGYGSGGFDTCVKSSILWNFPDATDVNIGNGKTSEFQGSLLITGNLQMTTTGQTGRTIVLGDVTHNRGGSEFHSGEFNPPKPLPDPDCDDLTNGTLELSPSNPPTMAPTSKATEFDGCKTHKDEASRNRGVKDSDCSACTGSQKWWPCDLKPAACEGSKCKLY
jgi:choice-of-anchor A domain-containing protein